MTERKHTDLERIVWDLFNDNAEHFLRDRDVPYGAFQAIEEYADSVAKERLGKKIEFVENLTNKARAEGFAEGCSAAIEQAATIAAEMDTKEYWQPHGDFHTGVHDCAKYTAKKIRALKLSPDAAKEK